MATSKRTVSSTHRASRAAASAPGEVLNAPAINLQRIVKSVDPLGQAGAALENTLSTPACSSRIAAVRRHRFEEFDRAVVVDHVRHEALAYTGGAR